MKSVCCFLVVASLALMAKATEDNRIVCYFGSWSVYRPEKGKFAIENIDPKLCTHLIYTFIGLKGNSLAVLDPWQDLPDEWGKDGFGRFNALRKTNPSMKTLVAIGGWNEGSKKYSDMVSSPSSRSEFVRNVADFLRKHNFDGFDLDWEYPAQRGGSPSDVQNFVELLKELRPVFDKEGWLLTAAVGAAKSSASQSYIIPEVSKYLDFINLMTYDLHGSWEPQTGLNAPLYPAKSDVGFSRELTVDACVQYWLDQGVDPKKLTLGVASYGRTFTLVNPNTNAVGSPTSGPGSAGPYTREPGFFGYNEICDMLKDGQWTVHFDAERRVPYAYRGNQWVGYDNVKSIAEKAEYAKKRGLGGAMVWSIETDDFKGLCGESYPLIKTLNHVLRGGPAVSDVTPNPSQSTSTEATQQTTGQQDHSSTDQSDHSSSAPSQEADTSGICKAPGNVADPTTCERFFQCVPLNSKEYAKLVVHCPPGLCFKPESGICDWK